MWVLPAPGLLGDSTNSCDDSPGYVTMETLPAVKDGSQWVQLCPPCSSVALSAFGGLAHPHQTDSLSCDFVTLNAKHQGCEVNCPRAQRDW